jgi:hypothetical protein
VDNTSLAHPTRTNFFCDDQLFGEIAELAGITFGALRRAFVGE